MVPPEIVVPVIVPPVMVEPVIVAAESVPLNVPDAPVMSPRKFPSLNSTFPCSSIFHPEFPVEKFGDMRASEVCIPKDAGSSSIILLSWSI